MKSKILNVLIIFLIAFVIGIVAYVLLLNNRKKGITDLEFNKSMINLYVGETEKLDLTIKPDNINEEIIWESGNTNVATVDKDGLVTAINSGSTDITVTTKDGKIGCKCFVYVKTRVIESISLDKTTTNLKAGDSIKLNVTIKPEEFNGSDITWISSDSNIAEVHDGTITGIDNGDAIITAKVGYNEAKCIVHVTKPQVTPSPTPVPTVKPTPTPVPKKLEIHFINAGGFYDDAILIRSNEATIWIDGGRGASAVVKYLKELKVSKIDYVIGSHTEYDHIDAQGEIIKNFDVRHALYANSITNCGCSCDSTDVRHVNAALKNKSMQAEVQSVPSKLQIGDMTLYFLAPYKIGCNKNNNSFIFILEFGNNKFMFTGDADTAWNSLDTLVNNAKSLGLNDIKVDVFKHPHHGNQALPDRLFDLMGNKYVVVPNMNSPKNPTQTFRDKMNSRGIKVYRQSDSKTGNILITSDGNNITFTMDVEASTYAK